MTNSIAGKNCPYCQTRFAGNESAIICPQCGIPHHQDCWQENGGCTTFGCTGHASTASHAYSYQSAASSLPTTVDHIDLTLDDLSTCLHCGRQISMWDEHCGACGASTGTAPTRPTSAISPPPGQPYSPVYSSAVQRSPLAAALLNLLLPGAGYFYLDQIGKGFLILGLTVVLGIFTNGVMYLVMLCFSIVDCYLTAKRMKDG